MLRDRSAAPAARLTRRSALGIGAGAVVAGVTPLAIRGQSVPPERSASALALLLEVERAQRALYSSAAQVENLSPFTQEFITLANGHESRHVDLLVSQAGSAAGPDEARYDFESALSTEDGFIALAIELEDLVVATFNGQVGNMEKGDLEAAARIASVDAQHAAILRTMVGKSPAPDPVDAAITSEETVRGLETAGVDRGRGG